MHPAIAREKHGGGRTRTCGTASAINVTEHSMQKVPSSSSKPESTTEPGNLEDHILTEPKVNSSSRQFVWFVWSNITKGK